MDSRGPKPDEGQHREVRKEYKERIPHIWSGFKCPSPKKGIGSGSPLPVNHTAARRRLRTRVRAVNTLAAARPLRGAWRPTAPFWPPGLVPPSCSRSFPLMPWAVARTLESTVTVFFVFVFAVVGNVAALSWALPACCAESDTKTRAAPGAGTRIEQVFAD